MTELAAKLEETWMTRAEVAERLRVSTKTMAQWACAGTGPRYAIFGKFARYRLSDVVAWENSQFGDGAA